MPPLLQGLNAAHRTLSSLRQRRRHHAHRKRAGRQRSGADRPSRTSDSSRSSSTSRAAGPHRSARPAWPCSMTTHFQVRFTDLGRFQLTDTVLAALRDEVCAGGPDQARNAQGQTVPHPGRPRSAVAQRPGCGAARKGGTGKGSLADCGQGPATDELRLLLPLHRCPGHQGRSAHDHHSAGRHGADGRSDRQRAAPEGRRIPGHAGCVLAASR